MSSRGKLDYTYNIDYYDKGHISKVLRFSKFADSQRMKDIMKKITDKDIHKWTQRALYSWSWLQIIVDWRKV